LPDAINILVEAGRREQARQDRLAPKIDAAGGGLDRTLDNDSSTLDVSSSSVVELAAVVAEHTPEEGATTATTVSIEGGEGAKNGAEGGATSTGDTAGGNESEIVTNDECGGRNDTGGDTNSGNGDGDGGVKKGATGNNEDVDDTNGSDGNSSIKPQQALSSAAVKLESLVEVENNGATQFVHHADTLQLKHSKETPAEFEAPTSEIN